MPPRRPATALTIGIDARAATEVPAGRGRLLRELLKELAKGSEQFSLRLYARQPWESLRGPDLEWVRIDAADPLWHLLAARRATRECDVFLSSNSYLTGWFLGIPDVVLVYDLLALDRSIAPNRRSAVVERLTMRRSIRRAASLVCISNATADALVTRYPFARERVRVALPGVTRLLPDERDTEGDQLTGVPDRFVLAVGTLEPRKNLPRLVEAYARLPDALAAEHPLVVVGAAGWRTGETARALDSLDGRVIRLGHVPDAALAVLYGRCTVFCYPSMGEGFGLPVLEAMAAGAAVLTSGVSALPEVGGDAVAYCDPLSVDDIARSLQAMLEDPARRAELSGRALARSQEFTWRRFAEAVVEALAVAGSHER